MMIVIEILAVLFSLLSVILTIKEKKSCWYVGIVGTIFYQILFYKYSLWGNFYLQFLFIIQSILGIINWNKPKDDIKISWVDNTYINILSTLALFSVVFLGLNKYGGSDIFMDSITTTLSIMATGSLIFKNINGWIYWIIADVFFMIMFFNNALYLSMFIYFVFMVLSVIGLFEWIKKYKNEKV